MVDHDQRGIAFTQPCRGGLRQQLIASAQTHDHQGATGELRALLGIDQETLDPAPVGEGVLELASTGDAVRLDQLAGLVTALPGLGGGIAFGRQGAIARGLLGATLRGSRLGLGPVRRGAALALFRLLAGGLLDLVLLHQTGLEQLFLQGRGHDGLREWFGKTPMVTPHLTPSQSRVFHNGRVSSSSPQTAAHLAGPIAGLANMPPDQWALAWPGGGRTAASLRHEIGVLAARAAALAPEDDRPLAIVSASRPRMAIGVLAALALGRPALPLDPTRTDLETLLAACPPAGALVDADVNLPQALPSAGLAVVGGIETPAAWPQANKPLLRANAPALLAPTSGTGGQARIAMLTAAALDAHVAASSRRLPEFTAVDRWLVCLPMTSIGALAAMWRVYSRGGSLAVLEHGFDARAVRVLMAEGASHVSLVPAMLDAVAAVADVAPPRGLRCLLSGGGPLSTVQAVRIRSLGWPLWQGWGMTESASHVAAGPVDEHWTPGVVGHPLPGVTVAQSGADARLRIGGPMLMSGYAHPGLVPGTGLDDHGRVVTGDTGEWLPDGRLRILGRADDVIVTGGVNVHPEGIEARFAQCPEAGEVAITGRPDARWGHVLVALYTGPAAPEQLAAWARAALPGSWRPREFTRVPALPRNAMGKLQRAALTALQMTHNGNTTATPADPPAAVAADAANSRGAPNHEDP